jgi:hypothetical protein
MIINLDNESILISGSIDIGGFLVLFANSTVATNEIQNVNLTA